MSSDLGFLKAKHIGALRSSQASHLLKPAADEFTFPGGRCRMAGGSSPFGEDPYIAP